MTGFEKILKKRSKWIGQQMGIGLVFLLVAFATYHSYLTNEFTPGGDGPRIYRYLKYMEKVPERFPFWQAHKHWGYPLIADPENHMPLSLILDTESEYFNFQMNLVFFFLTALFAFIIRSIALMIGLSQIASFFAGLLTIFSCIFIIRGFFHGAITAFFHQILLYASLCILFFVMTKKKYFYLIVLVPILLSWTIQMGYYLPILFHIPAFVLLMCIYLHFNESFVDSLKKSIIVLIIVTISMIFCSMPFFLPILDGVFLSGTFGAETPTIEIRNGHYYNYFFGLWPFIIMALLFTSDLFYKYAILFFFMGCLNLILILLNIIGFNGFFELWSNMPVLKNIRHQFIFPGLTGISAAFCAGIFIDSCKEGIHVKKKSIFDVSMLAYIILLIFVACQQYITENTLFMIIITLIFIFATLFRDRFFIVLGLVLVMSVLLMYDLKKSPLCDRFLCSENKQQFMAYDGLYHWRAFYGWDKFTPNFHQSPFSMVFMREYRLLLSLLYNCEINVQRPHWAIAQNQLVRLKKHPGIAQLMGIGNTASKEWAPPFRVYDSWIVAGQDDAVAIMRKKEFSPLDPIILDKSPGILPGPDIPLKSSVVLVGKTAETFTLRVGSNKNGMLFIPEIFHRDWIATVNGHRVPVIKAFVSFRAVPVTPGEHVIHMKFVYKPFRLGLYIALGALLTMIILMRVFRHRLERLFWPDKESGI